MIRYDLNDKIFTFSVHFLDTKKLILLTFHRSNRKLKKKSLRQLNSSERNLRIRIIRISAKFYKVFVNNRKKKGKLN